MRVADAAKIAIATPRPFLLWCNLNDESAQLAAAIPGAVEVSGADSTEAKERAMLGFASGEIIDLVTKPSIAGFGMNWQHCADMAFVGLSDSYEQFYQAVRRCWRFGQKQTVNVYVITAETEGAVVANIKRKEADAMKMAEEMVGHMRDLNIEALHGATTTRQTATYERDVAVGDGHGNCTLATASTWSEQPSDSDRQAALYDILPAVRVALYLLEQRPGYGERRRRQ